MLPIPNDAVEQLAHLLCVR